MQEEKFWGNPAKQRGMDRTPIGVEILKTAKNLISSYRENLGLGAIKNGHASGGIARSIHEELIINQNYQAMDSERKERRLKQFCEAYKHHTGTRFGYYG